MLRIRHAFAALAACLLALPAVADDRPGRLQGPLVFELPDGDYLGFEYRKDQPLQGIRVPRGTPGALHWRSDGLKVVTWRGDVTHAYLPTEGGTATIMNANGDCLTVRAIDDIRWTLCRGGDTAQVWQVADGTLVAPAPWRGYLDYQDGENLRIVKGDVPMRLVTSVLNPVD